MTPQEKKREQMLLKHYNLSLEQYNQMAFKGCWLCGGKGVTRSLNVDHDHVVEKMKVCAVKSEGVWKAWAPQRPSVGEATGSKRAEVVHTIHRRLLRSSVRGVLCWRHNRGIELFDDRPERLRAAAEYLEDFLNA